MASAYWQVPALGAVAYTLYKLQASRNRLRYPPGPPGELLIGNLRSMPLKDEDAYFTELSKEYGGYTFYYTSAHLYLWKSDPGKIIHFEILGRHVVVLNDVDVATDLLDKRSSTYSGRPCMPMAEILDMDRQIGFLSDQDEYFRLHRRYIQKHLVNSKIMRDDQRSLRARESQLLARRLLAKPNDWEQSIIHFATALTIESLVGHQITSDDDPYLEHAQNNTEHVTPTLKPPEGALVDIFPLMKRLPGWFPGNYWVGKARFATRFVADFRDYALADTRERMGNGTATPSFLVSLLEDMQSGKADPKMNEKEAKDLAFGLFTAGTDTTSSTLANFMAALLLFPECQERAQKEIDQVVGSQRLPNISDKPALPYVEGFMHEVSRWRPSLPLGVPHAATANDVYDGMFIPNGTVVLANIKAMGLDESVYHDPERFDPSRYLRYLHQLDVESLHCQPDLVSEEGPVLAASWLTRQCGSQWRQYLPQSRFRSLLTMGVMFTSPTLSGYQELQATHTNFPVASKQGLLVRWNYFRKNMSNLYDMVNGERNCILHQHEIDMVNLEPVYLYVS